MGQMGFTTWTVQATSHNFAWDVVKVNFLTVEGWRVTGSNPGCHIVSSGTVNTPGYEPHNVFAQNSKFWGGRKDPSGKFYIGLTCSGSFNVAAVQSEQSAGHSVGSVSVWRNDVLVAEQLHMPVGYLHSVWMGA